MFGSTRRKATAAATEAVSPLVRTLEFGGELGKRFWSDPYALGFISFSITAVAKVATNGKIKSADLGRCLQDVLAVLTTQPPESIMERINHLTATNNPDFLLGLKNADKIIFYSLGDDIFDDDPDVQRASRDAAAMGNSLDLAGPTDQRVRTISCLQRDLFFNRVRHLRT